MKNTTGKQKTESKKRKNVASEVIIFNTITGRKRRGDPFKWFEKRFDAAMKFDSEEEPKLRKKYPLGSLSLYGFMTWKCREDALQYALEKVGAKNVKTELHFRKEDGFPDGHLVSWDYDTFKKPLCKPALKSAISGRKINLPTPAWLEAKYKKS